MEFDNNGLKTYIFTFDAKKEKNPNITIAEFYVFLEENLTPILGKSSVQSHTFGNKSSDLAVDGNSGTCAVINKSVFCSNKRNYPHS